ncbi:MAG: glycosyltransferase family 2 protein [Shimia sp.]|jgi:glycosyltransferase involved in cell wall biosynthesis|uniref:glycosyltransferase family 2 protein n=1 Tax=Shimia sp. TaxID=1954381 RepID=UPI00405867A6
MLEKPEAVRLSIVIPTKNRLHFLKASVTSALQAIPATSAEIVVVDDHSDIFPYENFDISDPRVRILGNEGTSGAGGARNYGAQNARGKVILFLDDDDILVPGYPSWVLTQEADYGFSAIDNFSGDFALDTLQNFPGDLAAPVETVSPFRKQIFGLGCGFWIKRDAFLSIGGISETLKVNEDTDLAIRLLASDFLGVKTAGSGVCVRKHEISPNQSGQAGHLTHAFAKAQRAAFFEEIIANNATWLATRPDAMQFLIKRKIKLLVQAGDERGAWRAIRSNRGFGRHFGLIAYFCTEVIAARFSGRKT